MKIVKIASTGQHNDARMNLAIGLTAVRHGASAANHVEVLSLLKQKGMFCEFSNISNHCWIFFRNGTMLSVTIRQGIGDS